MKKPFTWFSEVRNHLVAYGIFYSVLYAGTWLLKHVPAYKDHPIIIYIYLHPWHVAAFSLVFLPGFYIARWIRKRSQTRRLIYSVGLYCSYKDPTNRGTVWETIRGHISNRPGSLFILASTGWNIFGKPEAPLYETLSSFEGEIRICLLNPNCDHFPKRAADLGIDVDQYTKESNEAIEYCRRLQGFDKHIAVMGYNSPPLWTMLIIGEFVWIKHYRPHERGVGGRFYCFYANEAQSSLYQPFVRFYLDMWDRKDNIRIL